MIDTVEPKWVDFKLPDDVQLKDIIQILTLMDLRVNVNAKDPLTQRWIRDHKHWFKKGGE